MRGGRLARMNVECAGMRYVAGGWSVWRRDGVEWGFECGVGEREERVGMMVPPVRPRGGCSLVVFGACGGSSWLRQADLRLVPRRVGAGWH